MDVDDLLALIICSITEFILIVFFILWIQQLCCVVDRVDRSTLCRTIYVLILTLLFIVVGPVVYIASIEQLAFKIGYLSVQQIGSITICIIILVWIHVFKTFMKQWIINYVTNETVKRYNLRVLFILQLVISIISIVFYKFSLAYPQLYIVTIVMMVSIIW